MEGELLAIPCAGTLKVVPSTLSLLGMQDLLCAGQVLHHRVHPQPQEGIFILILLRIRGGAVSAATR